MTQQTLIDFVSGTVLGTRDTEVREIDNVTAHRLETLGLVVTKWPV